ncbi:MAG: flagellar hook-basal body complex protein FliE [Acidocella sp. 20-61-6]|nr:MAG: flagellar hook-basal body complex protein FliE [Acidocella sp. 20-61-6]
MTISTILAVANHATAPVASGSSAINAGTNSFFDMINTALTNVSAAQKVATAAESSYAAGLPGATLGNALVNSDRAEVAWNATVAVRNEVVSAYQSIMNMPI